MQNLALMENTMESSDEPSFSGQGSVSLDFDWDEQNVRHLGLHEITTEAEQVILNRRRPPQV